MWYVWKEASIALTAHLFLGKRWSKVEYGLSLHVTIVYSYINKFLWFEFIMSSLDLWNYIQVENSHWLNFIKKCSKNVWIYFRSYKLCLLKRGCLECLLVFVLIQQALSGWLSVRLSHGRSWVCVPAGSYKRPS